MSEFKAFISDNIPLIREDLSKYVQGESLETMIMVFLAEFFFRDFLGFGMLINEAFKSLLETVDCKKDRITNTYEAIEREFFSLLSKMTRSKSIIPVLKRRGMCFENDGISFIVDGNRLYIPIEIIEAILAQMTTTKSLERLMNA